MTPYMVTVSCAILVDTCTLEDKPTGPFITFYFLEIWTPGVAQVGSASWRAGGGQRTDKNCNAYGSKTETRLYMKWALMLAVYNRINSSITDFARSRGRRRH